MEFEAPFHHEFSRTLAHMIEISGRSAVVIGFVSHIVRTLIFPGSSVEELRSDILHFRSEILRAEQTIRRSQVALEGCLDWSSVQTVVIRLLGIAVVQAITVLLVWHFCGNRYRSVPSTALTEEDSSPESTPKVEKDEGFHPPVTQGIPLRTGPLRPSDLRQLSLQHGCGSRGSKDARHQ